MKKTAFGTSGPVRVASKPIRLPIVTRASRPRSIFASVHVFQLALCLICLWNSSRTALGGIDNSGTIPINVLNSGTYGHPGTFEVLWSGGGGAGSAEHTNYDPGTRVAGTQYNAYDAAYIECQTVYSCPPGDRLTLTGTVSGEANDGSWHISGGFTAQGLSCSDNYDFTNAFFTWDVNIAASGMHTKPNDAKTCVIGGGAHMAQSSVHLALASLNVEDTPLRYRPGRGAAIDFTVTYNERGIQLPPSAPNLGPLWTFNWMSYVTDDPAAPTANASVFVPRGGGEMYTGFDQGVQSLPDPQSHAVLVRTSDSPIV